MKQHREFNRLCFASFNNTIPSATSSSSWGKGLHLRFGPSAALITAGPSALYELPWFYAKLFLITIVCQACLYYNELYDLNIIGSMKELAVRLIQSFGVAGIFLSFVYFAFPETIIRSVIFMPGVGIVIVVIACWRFGYLIVLNRGIFNQRIILLGSGDLTRKIRDEINRAKTAGTRLPWRCRRPIEDGDLERPADVALICGFRFEGSANSAGDLERKGPSSASGRNVAPCRPRNCCAAVWKASTLIEGNSFYEMLTGKLLVESINPSWLIFSNGFPEIANAADRQAYL